MTGGGRGFPSCFRWHIDNSIIALYDVGNYKPFCGLFMLQTIHIYHSKFKNDSRAILSVFINRFYIITG